ncbi:MAG: hypothetical protein OEU50_24465 [Gammaproteobacteria bacterium]|nr:hypothetical protein [Gammaproteobacteria bacterium]
MHVEPQQLPITETSLSSYFRKRMTRYARRFRPPPHEDTCWYLGSLLERLGRSEQLFAYQDGQTMLRPLALLYNDAIEADNARERCLMLQQLGDMALFLGALFPERFTRHGILQDYFVGMGGSAYDYLADNAKANRHVFAELANTFTRMLEMVANACSRRQRLTTEEVLALYQRWLSTGDPVVENQLRALGIDLAESELPQ